MDANSRSPTSSWKHAKLQDTSDLITASPLKPSSFEDMGISMLDSEESSSSVSSAIILAASADENSNEATPNLDAPKFCHHRINYRTLNVTLDTSTEDAGNSFSDTIDNSVGNLKCDQQRNNGNTKFEILNDVSHTSNENSGKICLPQSRKVAILGAGAGMKTSTISCPNSNLNSSNLPPATVRIDNGTNGPHTLQCKSTRSPLATVISNRQRSLTQQQQQGLNVANSPQAISGQIKAQAAAIGTTTLTSIGPSSPSMPSTSQQAAFYKHQQHQNQFQKAQIVKQHQIQSELQQQQQQQLKPPPPRFVPDENFFLYRNHAMRFGSNGKDYFTTLLSDEIVLQIFKWLPKKTLIRCSYVCRRFNRCANDESLWTRLDLGGRSLRDGSLGNVVSRGVVILRLAQAEINHPVFKSEILQNEPKYETKLQYLDLSMTTITKPSLKMLLSRCRQLKKLSLEHIPINDEICNEIAKNVNLEALNLAMCAGLEAWSVRALMSSLNNLNSLNISWTNLSVDAVTSLVTNITPNIMRLNIAGCRKTMFDSHLGSLVSRCSQLLELDLSDCTGLTAKAIGILCKFNMLEYLSLSRCYQIPASSYMELSGLPTLTYLDVFGILSDTALEMLERNFPSLGINKFIHSSVARPTVGTRRTSIWGLRTRD